MKEKKKHYRSKYYICKFVDIAISILPLLIYLAFNVDKYFGVKTTIISNMIGFALLVGMLVIILLKKTQILQGMVGLVVLELLVVFLDVYIQDLKYILGFAILGLFISKISTNFLVQRYKRLADKEETARENADALNNGIDKIVKEIKGLGRA